MSKTGESHKATGNRRVQLLVVLVCAAALKFYYSSASVNGLRWILAPTTFLVELITGKDFEFESHAGYMSRDHTFLIAASCAGVNFLITSFLMVSLTRLWSDHSCAHGVHQTRWSLLRHRFRGWGIVVAAAAVAYLATIVANTIRISTALMRGGSTGMGGLSRDQLHRFEGIFIYFGFLLLLYLVSEKRSHKSRSRAGWGDGGDRIPLLSCDGLSVRAGRFRPIERFLIPLLVYYGVTLGIPLANGAYRQGADFWAHSLFVLLVPLLLILPLAAVHFLSHLHRRG